MWCNFDSLCRKGGKHLPDWSRSLGRGRFSLTLLRVQRKWYFLLHLLTQNAPRFLCRQVDSHNELGCNLCRNWIVSLGKNPMTGVPGWHSSGVRDCLHVYCTHLMGLSSQDQALLRSDSTSARKETLWPWRSFWNWLICSSLESLAEAS